MNNNKKEVKNRLLETLGVQIGLDLAGNALQKKLMEPSNITQEIKPAGDYLLNFAKRHNVKVTQLPKNIKYTMFQPKPPYYNILEKEVVLKDPPYINSEEFAHELGHFINHTKYKKLLPLKLGGLFASLIATAAASTDLTDNSIKKDRVLLPTLGLSAAALAGQVPTLYDEAMASKRGMQLLKDSKTMSTEQILKASKSLKKAFAAHAIAAGIATASPAIAIGIKKYFYDKENKRK